jgi:hypothetical protein
MSTKRYWVIMKSGRKFMVEELGDPRVEWGNINPATKKLEKVSVKEADVIDESNTKITKENGFKNICFLAPGTSALGYIEALDASSVERIEDKHFRYEDEK